MKIEKKALVNALRKAQKFTGKALPILANVLIDGENQMIVATDLTTRFETPLKIKDYEQTVTGNVVEMDEEDLRAQLEDLKKDQLVEMAKYAQLQASGKKADLVERLITAAEEASASETAMTEDLKFKEAFCANPGKLRKIVESLEIEGSDMVHLVPDVSAEINRGLFEVETKATRLSVGEHFKSLEIVPADEFPEFFDVQDAEPIAKIAGKDLMSVVNVCASVKEGDQRPHTECLYFDGPNGMVVTTDGNRLHALEAELGADKAIPIDFRAMRAIGQLAGKEEVEISFCDKVNFAVMKYDGDTVSVRVDTDTQFPAYKDILNGGDGQTVKIEKDSFNKMLKQAVLVTNLDYKAVQFTFNGGLDAFVENPDEGAYHRESIEMDGVVDPEISVGLNPRFLMDALNATSEESVSIRLDGEDKPVHVLSEKFQAVIMPMRT